MKFPRIHTLKEIAQLLDCKYIGNEDFPVLGLNEIHVVKLAISYLWTTRNIMQKP